MHNPDVISRLLSIWQRSPFPDAQYTASWAISSLPLIDRRLKPLKKPDSDLLNFIKQKSPSKTQERPSVKEMVASLVIAFYLKAPWSDRKLAQLVASKISNLPASLHKEEIKKLYLLLMALGKSGETYLKIINRNKDIIWIVQH